MRVLLRISILKNLRIGEFHYFAKERQFHLKIFLWAKARQSNYQITLVLEDNSYGAAAVRVGINDLVSCVKVQSGATFVKINSFFPLQEKQINIQLTLTKLTK